MRTFGILVAIAAACGGAKPPATPAPTTPASEASTTAPATAPFDRQFIDAMVPHHTYLIALAEVVKERSGRPELQTYAEGLIRTAQGEVDRMVEWRRGWYGSAEVPSYADVVMPEGVAAFDRNAGWGDMATYVQGLAGGKDTTPRKPADAAKPAPQAKAGSGTLPSGETNAWTAEQRVAALRAANVDVDKVFLDVVIPLAENGVEMARVAQTRAEKAEFREFARSVRDTQERALSQAKQWRDTWYAPVRMHTPAP